MKRPFSIMYPIINFGFLVRYRIPSLSISVVFRVGISKGEGKNLHNILFMWVKLLCYVILEKVDYKLMLWDLILLLN